MTRCRSPRPIDHAAAEGRDGADVVIQLLLDERRGSYPACPTLLLTEHAPSRISTTCWDRKVLPRRSRQTLLASKIWRDWFLGSRGAERPSELPVSGGGWAPEGQRCGRPKRGSDGVVSIYSGAFGKVGNPPEGGCLGPGRRGRRKDKNRPTRHSVSGQKVRPTLVEQGARPRQRLGTG